MDKTKKLVILQMELNDINFKDGRERFKELAHKKYEMLSGMDIVELFDSMYNLVKQWDKIEEEYKSEK